jgi:tetratricopeptide (TPR) repeat protein
VPQPFANPVHSAKRATVSEVRAELRTLEEELSDSIEVMQQEIGALQVQAMEKKRPWYCDVTTMVATLAFLLSLCTTLFSYWQTQQQQLHNNRAELRSLLQRLSELPKENAILTQTYTDRLISGQIGGYIQQENAMLAKHAAELMRTLPANAVSSSEYIMVSNALSFSALYEESLQLLETADVSIRDASDGSTIYRSKAILLFQTGDFQGGRTAFQQALDIFQRYPTSVPNFQTSSSAFTQMGWAQAEAGQGQCVEARQHIAQARQLIQPLVIPGVPNPLAEQIEAARALISKCVPKDKSRATSSQSPTQHMLPF